MVIHGPDLETFKEHKLRTKELDMFVSERYLVTIHEKEMKSIDHVMGRAKSDARLALDQGIDMLLYSILDKLVDYYEPILEYLGDALDELEDEAAECPTTDLLTRISAKKRELLNLRRIIGPQREVWPSSRAAKSLHPPETRVYLRDVDHSIERKLELYSRPVQGPRHLHVEHQQQPQSDHEDADDLQRDRCHDGDHRFFGITSTHPRAPSRGSGLPVIVLADRCGISSGGSGLRGHCFFWKRHRAVGFQAQLHES